MYSFCHFTVTSVNSQLYCIIWKVINPSIPIRATDCSRVERWYRRLGARRHIGCPAHLISSLQCSLAILQHSTEGYMWILLHQLLHCGLVHLQQKNRSCDVQKVNERGNIMSARKMDKLGSWVGLQDGIPHCYYRSGCIYHKINIRNIMSGKRMKKTKIKSHALISW